jgi:hypothetical protein
VDPVFARATVGWRALTRVIAASLAVVVAVTVVLAWQFRSEGRQQASARDPVSARPPAGFVGQPVWYDWKGLHHGDVVEQTPVSLFGQRGALALVRSGALYLDPAKRDVWFHPWGGKPRLVGHNSEAGPGGDPNGDTAAWFDGSHLVVYDTASGRTIGRTEQGDAAGATGGGGEHYPTGNGFLDVNAEHITWSSSDLQRGTSMYSHDVRAARTSAVRPPNGRFVVDVHGGVQARGGDGDLFVQAPGLAEEHFSNLGPHVRLSPSGKYVLAVEETDTRFGPAIVDTRTGEVWRTPMAGYPWIAWSYDDIALVDTEDAVIACDAAHRVCKTVDLSRPVLLPTS